MVSTTATSKIRKNTQADWSPFSFQIKCNFSIYSQITRFDVVVRKTWKLCSKLCVYFGMDTSNLGNARKCFRFTWFIFRVAQDHLLRPVPFLFSKTIQYCGSSYARREDISSVVLSCDVANFSKLPVHQITFLKSNPEVARKTFTTTVRLIPCQACWRLNCTKHTQAQIWMPFIILVWLLHSA